MVKRERWPALPRRVRGLGGPIRVRQVLRPHAGDTDAWGTWELATRTIHIAKHARPAMRWRVFYHELAHAAIDDAGVGNLLTHEGEETLCDALATARIQEMRGILGLNE